MKRRRIDKNYIYESPSESENISDDSVIDLDSDSELKLDYKTRIQLNQIRNYLKAQEPNLFEILHSKISLKQKAELVQLFELYKTLDFSEESINLCSRLNSKFSKYKSFKEEKSKKEDEEEIEDNLRNKILSLNTNQKNKKIILSKLTYFESLSNGSDEKQKLSDWINNAISLPYDNIKTLSSPYDKILQKTLFILNSQLYGMEKVKEQILVFINARLHNSKTYTSLGLIGSPGTGKTQIARCLSEALNFPFEQISLAGIRDPNYLLGHSFTYIGSEPGEISQSLKRMEYKNGILFFDEMDKTSPEIENALLSITDFSQNTAFKDVYLAGIELDLSSLFFIYSMNKLPLNRALCDRLHIIKVTDYTFEDKIKIVDNFILPKTLKNYNIKKKVSLDTKYLINKVSCNESGVRCLDKAINQIVSKLFFIEKNKDIHLSFKIPIKYPLFLKPKEIDILLETDS